MPDKENVNHHIKLAEKFGGVEEIQEFMENYSTNIFKRKGIQQQMKKWGDIEHDIEQLEELGILKDTPFGKVLTTKGLKLKEYVINHKCELETEIRRNTRRLPSGGGGRFKKLGNVDSKTAQVEYTNRNRTVNDPDKNWSGDLAVPETVIQVKNSYLRRQSFLHKAGLHYYEKKRKAIDRPVN